MKGMLKGMPKFCQYEKSSVKYPKRIGFQFVTLQTFLSGNIPTTFEKIEECFLPWKNPNEETRSNNQLNV